MITTKFDTPEHKLWNKIYQLILMRHMYFNPMCIRTPSGSSFSILILFLFVSYFID